MPYKSIAQRKMMHVRMPELAKKWDMEEKTIAYKKKKKASDKVAPRVSKGK